MYLSSILDQSCFATIATITKDSMEKLQLFYEYNQGLIKQFPHVIISTNSLDDTSIHTINLYHNTWRKLVPNCIILNSTVNKGHMFGTIDLEEAILEYIKRELPEVQYLWKSMDDVITTTDLIDLDVEEADFYYLPGFSYESILIAGGKDNLHKNFESDYWTPQTTFFILNINNIDSLYGNDVDSKMHLYQKEKARNEHIKPWEMSFDIKFDCETHLGRTTKDLKKHCLVEDQFEELIEMVYYHKMGDPSHKNIYFYRPGICHYHYYKDLIYNV